MNYLPYLMHFQLFGKAFASFFITILLVLSCSDSSTNPDETQYSGWAISPSSTNGYASVIFTSNSGKVWTRQGNPFIFSDVEFSDVSALNSTTAFISGFDLQNMNGLIFKTTDAGKTWINLQLPNIVNGKNLNCIRTGKNNTVIAGGNAGMFLISTDAGVSWQEKNIPVPDSNYSIFRVDCDGNQRLIAGVSNDNDGFAMYYSYDSGNTWSTQSSKNEYWNGLIDVSWVQGTDIIYASGTHHSTNGCYNISKDAGKTWTLIDTMGMSHFNAIFAYDSNSVWTGADRENFARTTNGGTTWEKQILNFNGIWILGISAVSQNELWVVGCAVDLGYNPTSTILHSKDAGKTWEEQTVPESILELWRVSFKK